MTVRPVSGRKMRASRFCIPQSYAALPFRKKASVDAGVSVWKFFWPWVSASGMGVLLRVFWSAYGRRDHVAQRIARVEALDVGGDHLGPGMSSRRALLQEAAST